MTIDIITLFPDMFKGPFDESMIKRAKDKELITINFHNLRNWAIDKRGTVDGRPYSGGVGMLLRPEPIFDAVVSIKNKQKTSNQKSRTILLDAGGSLFNQQKAQELSKLDHIILICGHYEGVDYRVHKHLADETISIGEYVLTGGEIPTMVIVDSIIRLIPGVLGKDESSKIESFSMKDTIDSSSAPQNDHYQHTLIEYPQFTRPEVYRRWKVPEILLSGNHAEIEKWRVEEAKKRTKKVYKK